MSLSFSCLLIMIILENPLFEKDVSLKVLLFLQLSEDVFCPKLRAQTVLQTPGLYSRDEDPTFFATDPDSAQLKKIPNPT